MCTNPVTILRKASDYESPYKLIRPLNPSAPSPLDGLRPYSTFKAVVPCGKCVECLKRRQNDLAARAAREALKRGSMSFVTLTYANEFLPLSMTVRAIDKDTGEIINMPYEPLVRQEKEHCSKDFEINARGSVLGMTAGKYPRYWSKKLSFPDDLLDRYEYEAVVCPSLNRRDPRLWLKRCRVQYKREFGSPLPDFSYILVGEMGPNTCRPHYHVAFFGLDRKQVSWCCSQWRFGFTDMKYVNAVNPDGTPGYVLASKYIGKYVVKGRFECDSVKCGMSEKPRLCLSQGLGLDKQNRSFTLPEHIIDYYRCYDIYGKYDLETCRFTAGNYKGKHITQSQLNMLIDEIQKRNSITIAGVPFCLPLNFSKLIWYVKDPNGKIRASAFRRAYSAAVSFDPVLHLFDKLRAAGLSEDKILLRVQEFIESDQRSRLVQDSFDAQDFYRSYANSVF